MTMEYLINDFIETEIYDLQEEGNLCLEMCEEDEANYHMTSYWINGTYDNVRYFLENNYSDELCNAIICKYPFEIEALISKIKAIYEDCTKKIIAYEALASILLKEMQFYSQLYSIYGTEDIYMIYL